MYSNSPFSIYNLRRNPFGELRREERADLAVVEIDDWIEFLGCKKSVLQIIGPCGHGKTTHLLAIQKALGNIDYTYLPEDGPRPRVADTRPLIIDEAQRLSYLQLRRVLRIGGPLVFGTHVDLSQAIQRAKLKVMTVNPADDSSNHRLVQILNKRIEASRLTIGSVPRITESHADRLQHTFGSDIRAMEHFLYEQFQQCAMEQLPWPTAT